MTIDIRHILKGSKHCSFDPFMMGILIQIFHLSNFLFARYPQVFQNYSTHDSPHFQPLECSPCNTM